MSEVREAAVEKNELSDKRQQRTERNNGEQTMEAVSMEEKSGLERRTGINLERSSREETVSAEKGAKREAAGEKSPRRRGSSCGEESLSRHKLERLPI